MSFTQQYSSEEAPTRQAANTPIASSTLDSTDLAEAAAKLIEMQRTPDLKDGELASAKAFTLQLHRAMIAQQEDRKPTSSNLPTPKLLFLNVPEAWGIQSTQKPKLEAICKYAVAHGIKVLDAPTFFNSSFTNGISEASRIAQSQTWIREQIQPTDRDFDRLTGLTSNANICTLDTLRLDFLETNKLLLKEPECLVVDATANYAPILLMSNYSMLQAPQAIADVDTAFLQQLTYKVGAYNTLIEILQGAAKPDDFDLNSIPNFDLDNFPHAEIARHVSLEQFQQNIHQIVGATEAGKLLHDRRMHDSMPLIKVLRGAQEADETIIRTVNQAGFNFPHLDIARNINKEQFQQNIHKLTPSPIKQAELFEDYCTYSLVSVYLDYINFDYQNQRAPELISRNFATKRTDEPQGRPNFLKHLEYALESHEAGINALQKEQLQMLTPQYDEWHKQLIEFEKEKTLKLTEIHQTITRLKEKTLKRINLLENLATLETKIMALDLDVDVAHKEDTGLSAFLLGIEQLQQLKKMSHDSTRQLDTEDPMFFGLDQLTRAIHQIQVKLVEETLQHLEALSKTIKENPMATTLIHAENLRFIIALEKRTKAWETPVIPDTFAESMNANLIQINAHFQFIHTIIDPLCTQVEAFESNFIQLLHGNREFTAADQYILDIIHDPDFDFEDCSPQLLEAIKLNEFYSNIERIVVPKAEAETYKNQFTSCALHKYPSLSRSAKINILIEVPKYLFNWLQEIRTEVSNIEASCSSKEILPSRALANLAHQFNRFEALTQLVILYDATTADLAIKLRDSQSIMMQLWAEAPSLARDFARLAQGSKSTTKAALPTTHEEVAAASTATTEDALYTELLANAGAEVARYNNQTLSIRIGTIAQHNYEDNLNFFMGQYQQDAIKLDTLLKLNSLLFQMSSDHTQQTVKYMFQNIPLTEVNQAIQTYEADKGRFRKAFNTESKLIRDLKVLRATAEATGATVNQADLELLMRLRDARHTPGQARQTDAAAASSSFAFFTDSSHDDIQNDSHRKTIAVIKTLRSKLLEPAASYQ